MTYCTHTSHADGSYACTPSASGGEPTTEDFYAEPGYSKRQLAIVDEELDWQSGWYHPQDGKWRATGRIDCIRALKARASSPPPLADAIALLSTTGAAMHYGSTGMDGHPDPNTAWADCERPICQAAFRLSAPQRRARIDDVLARLSGPDTRTGEGA